MNPSLITSFALGEVTPADAARVRQHLAQSPEARAEYERIAQTANALRERASLPKRSLHPHQREAVLAAARKPAAPKPRMISFPVQQAKRPNYFSILAGLAAAACLAFGAFILGQKTAPRVTAEIVGTKPAAEPQSTPGSEIAVTKNEVIKEASPEGIVPPTKQPEEKPAALAVTTSVPPAAPAAKTEEAEIVEATVKEPAPVASAPAIVQTAPKPAFAPPAAPLFAFTSVTNAQQESALYFHPKMVKPVTQVFADKQIILAAPLPYNAKPTTLNEPKRKAEQPPLMIHTWKAEIATCPWDASRRLMRITATIPVDQPAVEANDLDYRIVAKFDPFQVQGYRIVAEKHLPPSNGGTLATRFAWYEIIPTRNFAPTADKPITLGSLEIAQPKRANNPDSTPLRLVDRGMKWSDAREDYVFETAMIGFGLLMQGTPNIGALDHRMVMELAEKTKGEDPKGERAKFIKVVQQAQRAAGL